MPKNPIVRQPHRGSANTLTTEHEHGATSMGQCIDFVRLERRGFDEAGLLINSVVVGTRTPPIAATAATSQFPTCAIMHFSTPAFVCPADATCTCSRSSRPHETRRSVSISSVR